MSSESDTETLLFLRTNSENLPADLEDDNIENEGDQENTGEGATLIKISPPHL